MIGLETGINPRKQKRPRRLEPRGRFWFYWGWIAGGSTLRESPEESTYGQISNSLQPRLPIVRSLPQLGNGDTGSGPETKRKLRM